MSSELPPLDDDLLALIDAERARPAPSPTDAARLVARVHASISGGGGPGQGGGPDQGNGPDPGSAPSVPKVSSALARALPVAVTSFILGGVVGAGLHARLSPSPPPIAAPAPLPTSAVPPTPPPSVEVVAAPPVPTPPRAATTTTPRRPRPTDPEPLSGEASDRALSEERALIEAARAAAVRGQPQASLASLAEHARRFPEGRLIEEREALWIQGLVAAGDQAQAQERAARFRRRFPDSLLLPAIDQVLAQ